MNKAGLRVDFKERRGLFSKSDKPKGYGWISAVGSQSNGSDLIWTRSNLVRRKQIAQPGSSGCAGRRRCSPELCSAAASSPEQAEMAPQGSIRPGSGSRMDYAPCVVHLGSLQASGWSAEARAATAAGRRGGGSPASAAMAPRVRHK